MQFITFIELLPFFLNFKINNIFITCKTQLTFRITEI